MVTMPSERLAERLEDLRAAAPSVELVVLFGSVARGRPRPDSDLDVAVRCDGPADLDALYLLLAPRLASSLLDLVDLRRAGSLLAFQVARHGRLLYERGPWRVPDSPVAGLTPLLRHRQAPPGATPVDLSLLERHGLE